MSSTNESQMVQNHTTSKKKQHKKKKIVIACLLAVVLILLFLLPRLMGAEKPSLAVLNLSDTTVLSYTDLEDSISESGTVESAMSMAVYSTLSYPVMEVSVDVGDYVEEGDLLAQLDGESIQDQISSQEVSLAAAAQSSAVSQKTAQDNYDNYKEALDSGLNSSLLNAQTQADSAYDSYIKAQNAYDRYSESLDKGENSSLLSAQSALNTAKSALSAAQTNYDSANSALTAAKKALKAAENTMSAPLKQAQEELAALQSQLSDLQNQKQELENSLPTDVSDNDYSTISGQIQELETQITAKMNEISEKEAEITAIQAPYNTAKADCDKAQAAYDTALQSLTDAQTNYNTQLKTYNAANTTADDTLTDYEIAAQNAWNSYQAALKSLEAAKKSTQDQLQSYENSLASAKAAGNTAATQESLRQLRADLEDTKITAPCSGTVTAVYAKVGSSGGGLLFVIEDVEDLVIETSVKGYDIGTVQTGMAVNIYSDATGDKEIKGVISSIAPTTKKNSQGTTDTTTEATFAAEVAVTTKDTGLRIGMDVDLDYIIAEESDVFAVPYDAVYENSQGQDCVLIASKTAEDQYTISELTVTTGVSNDLDIIISGENVVEGLRVINDPDSYMAFKDLTVSEGTLPSYSMEFPFQ